MSDVVFNLSFAALRRSPSSCNLVSVAPKHIGNDINRLWSDCVNASVKGNVGCLQLSPLHNLSTERNMSLFLLSQLKKNISSLLPSCSAIFPDFNFWPTSFVDAVGMLACMVHQKKWLTAILCVHHYLRSKLLQRHVVVSPYVNQSCKH